MQAMGRILLLVFNERGSAPESLCRASGRAFLHKRLAFARLIQRRSHPPENNERTEEGRSLGFLFAVP